MSTETRDMRTPLGRVRGLGSARSGTRHFWHQRVTAAVGVPLTVAFIVIVLMILGSNHAAVVRILAAPLVTILMLLFVAAMAYHMWIGMQEIIVDYVHHEVGKLLVLILNTSFCIAVGLCCAYALLKMSFGV